MHFRIGAHGRHFDVTLFVAFDQTVPALVPLFTDPPREVFGAHQAIRPAETVTGTVKHLRTGQSDGPIVATGSLLADTTYGYRFTRIHRSSRTDEKT